MQRRPLFYALFAAYLIILTWIILFKAQIHPADLAFRSLNLIPFSDMVSVRGFFGFDFALNLLAFVPFGFYMKMLFGEQRIWVQILPIFGVSLLFEVLQYIFALGASDVNDLISNTLGGLAGIGVYVLAKRIFKEKTEKVCFRVMLVGTVIMVLVLVFGAKTFSRMYNSEENRKAREEIQSTHKALW